MSYEYRAARTTFLKRAWLALLLMLPLPVLVEYIGWDLRLEDYYYSQATHTFPWRDVQWFKTLEHDALQNVLTFGAVLVVVALVLSVFSPAKLEPVLPRFWRKTRVLAYLLTALLSGPVVISILKVLTARQCPWHLEMYGGTHLYSDLWSTPLFDWRNPGRCFPASHASVGFALLAFVPLLAGGRRALLLCVALLLGLGMGWSRMMQGAHFLSHTLWSAWLCWALVLICYITIKPDVELWSDSSDGVLRSKEHE
jgi:membrane-associated PAP2 superfamily phosphatase